MLEGYYCGLELELGGYISFGISTTELSVVPVVFIFDGSAAVLEGFSEAVVIGGARTVVMAAVAMVFAYSGFEVADLFVLAFVKLGLLAFFDDAVVEVNTGCEGARDG